MFAFQNIDFIFFSFLYQEKNNSITSPKSELLRSFNNPLHVSRSPFSIVIFGKRGNHKRALMHHMIQATGIKNVKLLSEVKMDVDEEKEDDYVANIKPPMAIIGASTEYEPSKMDPHRHFRIAPKWNAYYRTGFFSKPTSLLDALAEELVDG